MPEVYEETIDNDPLYKPGFTGNAGAGTVPTIPPQNPVLQAGDMSPTLANVKMSASKVYMEALATDPNPAVRLGAKKPVFSYIVGRFNDDSIPDENTLKDASWARDKLAMMKAIILRSTTQLDAPMDIKDPLGYANLLMAVVTSYSGQPAPPDLGLEWDGAPGGFNIDPHGNGGDDTVFNALDWIVKDSILQAGGSLPAISAGAPALLQDSVKALYGDEDGQKIIDAVAPVLFTVFNEVIAPEVATAYMIPPLPAIPVMALLATKPDEVLLSLGLAAGEETYEKLAASEDEGLLGKVLGDVLAAWTGLILGAANVVDTDIGMALTQGSAKLLSLSVPDPGTSAISANLDDLNAVPIPPVTEPYSVQEMPEIGTVNWKAIHMHHLLACLPPGDLRILALPPIITKDS
tara:strand:- start:19438 stop:20655 length:1218 start_codon:yes stop_codon:yes gene_type:complete